jgi:hypothetical protein
LTVVPSLTLPTPKRLHDTVRLGQRWRRESDGLVIFVVQVHRADESVEAKPVMPAVPCRFSVAFTDLRLHYELLVSFRP